MNIGERLSGSRLKRISSLSRRKYREEYGQTLVEGFRAIEAARAGGAEILEVVGTHDALNQEAARKLLSGLDSPVFAVRRGDFDRISNVTTAQGIVAITRIDWAPLIPLSELDRIVVLDGVQDPGNAGTIIRTAAWMGIPGVLSGPGTADLFSPKVIRAAMGGVWDVRLARCTDLPAALMRLRNDGHRLAAADLGGTNVVEWRPSSCTVLVLGNEGDGISDDVRALVHDTVTVFRRGDMRATESLNVGIAAAIIMHYWTMDSRGNRAK